MLPNRATHHKCGLGINSNHGSNRLRPSYKKHAIFNRFCVRILLKKESFQTETGLKQARLEKTVRTKYGLLRNRGSLIKKKNCANNFQYRFEKKIKSKLLSGKQFFSAQVS